MASKLEKKKPVVKKPVTTETEPDGAIAANTKPASDSGAGLASKKDVVNAETAQVLRDADAGKNLLNYSNLEDMFKDLGM